MNTKELAKETYRQFESAGISKEIAKGAMESLIADEFERRQRKVKRDFCDAITQLSDEDLRQLGEEVYNE